MKASKPKAVGVSASGRQIVVRVSDEQYQRLANEAETAGLSVSECVRRHVFGGRPIVANSDTRLLNAVRSIGGLLKHNFQTLRDTAPQPELLAQHQAAYDKLVRFLEETKLRFHDY